MSFLLGALCACQLASAAPTRDAANETAALVALARTARYQQDSALAGYTALAKQRWSAGLGLAAVGGFGPIGRTRLGARFESVARVHWHHERGAWAELIASRAVAPIVGEMDPSVADDDIVFVLPYYPGRDRLWPLDEIAGAFEEIGGWIRHPLDAGADSLYRFQLGGALAITLPGGNVVRLREIQVRPVRPSDRLIVGSLWVDIANGALVRAAYRPSIAVDLWPLMEQNFDAEDRSLIEKFGPFRGNVEEIVIEHGLYAGRFWLPRVRIAHAEGTAKGGRITISIEQTFDYESVEELRAGQVQAAQPPRTPERERRNDGDWFADHVGPLPRERRCVPAGDSLTSGSGDPADTTLVRRGVRYSDGVRLRITLPCVENDLLRSPFLPASIYSPSEELFTEQDFDRLRNEVRSSLAISNQAAWEPQPVTYQYGLNGGMLRYNRIEALSAGVRAERLLGRGYALDVSVRLGVADLEPNAELLLRREGGRSEWHAGVFRRLDVANDWGNPLGLSASLGALLLGRDNGFYHRALGGELGGSTHRIAGGPTFSWRLFAEQQDAAEVSTNFSMAHVVDGSAFRPNIVATRGLFAGAGAAMSFALGEDPTHTQFSGTVRGEGAGGETEYGRAMVDLRLARGLGGSALGALTAAAGGSVGTLPPQRAWYLGGAQTIHAHRPGTASGDAFWMARAELSKGLPLVRPIIFGDVGWAGDRRAWNRSQERLIAAGAGLALFDGLIRVDLSRAMDATKRWSFDIFLEMR